jgi:hypothetical protein
MRDTRRMLADGVTRLSFFFAHTGPDSFSASVRIVRNLMHA